MKKLCLFVSFENIALITILMVNEMNEAKKGFTRNLKIVVYIVDRQSRLGRYILFSNFGRYIPSFRPA